MELAGKRILVMGMARSGVAVMRLLRTHGAIPIACDSRPLDQLGERIDDVNELADGYFVQSELETKGIPSTGASSVVLSPGVPADLPVLEQARAAAIDVIGEVELASSFLLGDTIGVTGTNGKTTTTALIGHLLQSAGVPVQVGGNIGKPACDLVESSRPGQWNVLELSSFQLETTNNLNAKIAVCLNITPDHLDRHHTFEAYAAAKRRLFEQQREGSFAVLNSDDPPTLRFGFAGPGQANLFTLRADSSNQMWLDGDVIMHEGRPLIRRSQIPLVGMHNVANVMAASLAALLTGVEPDLVARGISTFPGVEHRIEFVRERGGVRWYNDSKATNVDAALKAIDSFEQPLWIILGGRDKHSDYRPLAAALQGRVRNALLIGEAAKLIEPQIGAEVPCLRCDTMENAVATAANQAQAGDVVLLAPACASFDQFRSYEHRGHVFKELVNQLGEVGV